MEKKQISQNPSDVYVPQLISDVDTYIRQSSLSEPILIRDLLLPIQAMADKPNRNELLAKYFD